MKGKIIENISGVDCYEKDGTAYLKLENVARGLGFMRNKNGKDYVMWDRVEKYLNELGFHTCVENGIQTCWHDDFIPENIFYRLAMKAKNETAEKFQAKVADEIIPSIRKHGIYATDNVIDNILNNPDFGIELLIKLKEERQAKEMERQARIQAEQKNKQLDTDNKALSGKLLDWADRDRINAGIRKLAASTGTRFGDMYKELYKNIEYSHKIYLNSRMERDKSRKKNASCLDYVKDNEWAKILKTFCAMCEAYEKSPNDMMQQTTPKDKLSVIDNSGNEDKYAWLEQLWYLIKLYLFKEGWLQYEQNRQRFFSESWLQRG